MENLAFQKILKCKIEYYGTTEAAYQLAAEEYARQIIAETSTLYEFIYTAEACESACATMSIHRTRKGAEMALEFHKKQKWEEWQQTYPTKKDQEENKFGFDQYWDIRETEIEE